MLINAGKNELKNINESSAKMDSAEQYESCNNILDSHENMDSSKVSEKNETSEYTYTLIMDYILL